MIDVSRPDSTEPQTSLCDQWRPDRGHRPCYGPAGLLLVRRTAPLGSRQLSTGHPPTAAPRP
jgi:hypothetical protein